jgi:hypothetical protein
MEEVESNDSFMRRLCVSVQNIEARWGRTHRKRPCRNLEKDDKLTLEVERGFL